MNNYYLRPYFPRGYAYYPYYAPYHSGVSVYFSLYGFYGGWCAPYIYRDHCYYGPPSTVFIDVPVYVGDTCRGYAGDDYYVNRAYEAQNMLEALEEALAIYLAVEGAGSPDKVQFMEIARRDGLKAALAWRDGRFSKP